MANYVFALAAVWFIRRALILDVLGDRLSLAAAVLVCAACGFAGALPPVVCFGLGLAAAGVFSFLRLSYQWSETAIEDPLRRIQQTALLISLSLPVFLIAATNLLPNVGSVTGFRTLDPVLASADIALFGYLPASTVAGWFDASVLLDAACRLSYASIAVLLGVSMLNRSFALAFVVASLLGFAGYYLFPACGPRYAAPDAWPVIVSASQVSDLVPAIHPRNCVPSLHFAWALLMAVYVKNLPGKAWKVLVLLNVPLTALATLGLGEHYAIDLFAALPTVAAATVASRRLSGYLPSKLALGAA